MSKNYLLFILLFLSYAFGYGQTVDSFTPSNACYNSGASVVITGNGFLGVTAVEFNGASATFTIESDTQITATLPTSAITGTITVIGPVTITSATSFVVNPLPTASITTGGSTTFCQGGSVVLTSSTGSSYLWNTGVTTQSITVSTTGLYFVTVTDGNGCFATSEATAVTVNPLPTATAGGTQTICSNATAIVSGAASSNGTILWTENGAGSITADETTLTPTYTAAVADAGTTVTLTMTVTSNNACAPQTATATYTVNVTANNTIVLTSPTGTDLQTRCINTAITNITYATTGATGATFSGLPSDVTGSWTADVATITGTPTASGTFNYTVTLTGGCGSVNANGTITVTPNMTAAAASSSPTLCINTALTNITHATTLATGIGTPTSLPAGVTAAFAANTITISGTPTESGTFNYSIPLTGGCGIVNATGTITVTANMTVTAASSTPTLCINTLLTNITHATTLATGIGTPTSLPAGVTAAFAANTITISGTPTSSGTFNYSIPLTGGCESVNATGTITVTPNMTAAAASSNQTLCISTVLTAITNTTTGATGIGAATGLPTGVTASFGSNTITISGTPSVAGTFGYSIPLTGGCGVINATGTIIVTPNNTASAASTTPTLCISSALTAITHTTTGATGIGAATGLPTGVTASFGSNTITISGTPSVVGTFGYSIPLTGGCGAINATGTIIVTPNNTASAASSSPTLCISSALTAITHTTTGATGIGAATGLPTGVTAAFTSNTITISGTPTASGTFNYSIPLTGGCGSVNATGTITVTANNTFTLTGTDTQTICIGASITNIVYDFISPFPTNATVTGLPSGVGFSYASGPKKLTISGAPLVLGTFNYSITLTGGCGTFTGTITVTPNNTASAASSSPTLCINTALAAITHTTTGATGIGTTAGLPAGVTASFAANTITISGTPTASGTFNYSISLTGGCGAINATGTIIVTPNNTSGTVSSTPTLCINTALTPITRTTTGATGIGAATGLPAGVTAAFAANTITISGTPTAAGVFVYSIPLTGGCGSVNATGTITVQSIVTAGEIGTDQTICNGATPATLTSVTAGNGSGTITYEWQTNASGSYVTIAGATSATYSPPVLTTSTSYQRRTVSVQNGVTCYSAHTTPVTVTVQSTVTAGAIGSAQTICNGGDPVAFTSTTDGAGSGTITYRWESSVNPFSTWTTVAGQTANIYDIPSGLTVTTQYRRITISTLNTIACESSPTATIQVTVQTVPTAGAISAAQTICNGTTPAALTSTAGAGSGTISYEWQANGVDIPSATSATYSPLALTATTSYQRRTISSQNGVLCYSAYTTPVTITVQSIVTAGAIGTDQTICNGATPAALTSTTAGTGSGVITYQWQTNASGSYVTIGGATAATYSPPALTATTNYQRRTVSTQNSIPCYSAYTTPITITVNPLPTGSASPQTICNARTSSVALNSNIIGTTFTWTAAIQTTPAGGTVNGFSGCPTVCGNTIAQTLTNTGTTIGVVRYTVTPTANSCPGSTFTVDVTVNPMPVITLDNATEQCSTILTAPTYTDSCGVTVTATTADLTSFTTQGTYSVVWSFAFGTTITSTQNIIINDTIAPVATVTNLPALPYSGCQIDNLPIPTALDNCVGAINGTPNITFPFTTLGLTVVTWTYNDGNGNTSTQTQNITLTAPPISGGNLLGYLVPLTSPTVPTENIAISSCPDDINYITINLSNEIGTIVHWEKFEVGDTAWSIIPNSNDTDLFENILFDFSNTKSTLFRVLVQVGNCTQYSNMVNVHAIPPDVPPILDQNLFNICLNSSVSLIARSGYTSAINASNGGDYNTGQFPNKWDPTQWRIDGDVAGTAWTAAANNRNYNNWSGTNNHPVGTLYKIEYDSNDFKFGVAHGNFNSPGYISTFGAGPTTLETPLFSLVGLKIASVDFDQAYNLHAGDICRVELLIFEANGTTLKDTIVLQDLIGASPHALSWGDTHGAPVPYPYLAPQSNNSTTTYFDFGNDNSSFDVSDYIGNDNVRVKWTFFGTTDESTWAIDNINIPIKPYYDEVEWTDGIGNPGEYIIRDKLEVAIPITPTAPGVHQYGATSLINGCRAYDIEGTALATVKVNYAYAGEAQAYTNEQCGERTVNLNAYDNTKTAKQNFNNGAYPTLIPKDPTKTIDYNDDPGTLTAGKWSVFNTTNTCGTYSFSNDTSPTSSFSGDAGVYTLRWSVGTGPAACYSDVQVTLTSCNVIDFDGIDDYVTFKNNYGLGSAFSIEVWVKPDPQPANPPNTIQTIFSKRNANNLIDGYDLRLVGSTLSFNWNSGGQIISPYPLTTSRWYHVAVTYAGGIYKLYVDGIEVISAAGTAPIDNNRDCLAGAMDQSGNPPNKPVNHYSGWMDELRIWGVGLSTHHVRQMMNQQINNNGTAVRGEIIPIDINGPDTNLDGIDDQPLLWSNLNGYYRMNQITCGYLNPFGGKGVDGKLRNITSSQEETAPLPYVSIRDGNWMDRGPITTPWKYGDSVWDYPNSTGYNGTPIDWNIVRSLHNINSTAKDITLLGLKSESGKLTIANPSQALDEKNNGQGLFITHYLKLDGSIDLVGESQLVEKRYTPTQFSESILDVTSTGFIERDQQGKKNSYNYNYWSSPVSTIQGLSNNTPYSPASALRDGTNSANPIAINFGDGAYFADGAVANPILTSNRWIWSYNSKTLETNTDWEDYYQWNYVGNSGLLQTGEGFTMKGTGGIAAIDATQNYTFIGKPNNGTIALPLPYDQTYLVGNPYPSALDLNEFILDNLAGRAGFNVFNGALYFWDHFGLSNNHYLAEYQGGYATYTLVGGVKAINDSSLNLNDDARGSLIPQQFVPVGQGFFVDAYLDPALSGGVATVTGGTINFKNSQRVFQREDANPNTATSSVFMKKRVPTKAISEVKPKIRLGFDSSVGKHRQLLVGVDRSTTNLFDIGYDAPMFDTNENDMYWEISDSQFVIQGVPNFNTDQTIPLGVAIANEGEVVIKIDTLENVPSSTKIYLHDNTTGMYHDLKNSDFKIALAIGDYNKRFSLKFESLSQTLSVDENETNDGIVVFYSKNYKTLIIKNNDLDSTVNSVSLFNILGQALEKWDIEDEEQTNIQIPIKNMPSGVYVVKIKTTNGDSSKKIIIN